MPWVKRTRRGGNMKYVLVMCVAVSILFIPGSAQQSAAFDESFARFKNEFADKDYNAAYATLHSALELFCEKTPLLLRNVRFVKGEDNSYGIYEPKANNNFSSGEPLYLYLEPVGYAYKKVPAGYYEFGFKADFILEDEGGNELGGQKDFADLKFNSWNHNTEVSLTFTYSFTGFDKGKYKVVTKVRDANSNKSATVENWFYVQ
jgi:hypothetical protein